MPQPANLARVLVVEDEPYIAERVRDRLRRLGHEIVGIADTGSLAIRLAEQARPDVVLMDIGLKGPMDGIETAERIYRRLNIPSVYVTGDADHATFERAKATAQFGYVLKPFHERDLIIALDLAVHRHRVERHLKDSQLTYATILAGIADGVIACDERGCVRFLNPVAEALLGRRIEDVHGLPVEDVLSLVDELTREIATPISRALRERAAVTPNEPLVLLDKHGVGVPIEVTAAPVTDATGRMTGVVVAFRGSGRCRSCSLPVRDRAGRAHGAR